MHERKRKKKLNKLLQAILLTLLVTQTLCAENGNRSSNDLDSRSGIDLAKSYTGQEVQELIDFIMTEADGAIIEAYNAGYKQGVLAYKPDVEYWKVKAQGFEKELTSQKIKNWMFCLSGVSIGFLGGMGLGFGLRLSY